MSRIRMINSLGEEKTLPLGLSMPSIDLGIDIPTMPLHAYDGSVVTGSPQVQPRQLEIAGSIYDPNKSVIRSTWDDLVRFLLQGPLKIYKWEDRYIQAYCQGSHLNWLDDGAELEVRIPLLAPDPYWYGELESHAFSGTQTIINKGNVPVYPKCRGTSIVPIDLQNTTNGNILTIGRIGAKRVDCAEYTATLQLGQDPNNTINILNDVTSPNWFLDSWRLEPGANTIVSQNTIVIEFNPRYA